MEAVMASRFLVLSTAPPSNAAAHSLYSSSLRNWTAEKPACPSKTAAKENPWRREAGRSTTSSSISSRAPCSLALPHRMASSSDEGGEPAATPPAAVAWHRCAVATPRPQHRSAPAAEGGSRGTRGLSSAIWICGRR
uniref:Uncharacterized protein n=1 Tax=Arundo donax TaxID=35708 RepID=A0A0A9D8F9_ARUDO